MESFVVSLTSSLVGIIASSADCRSAPPLPHGLAHAAAPAFDRVADRLPLGPSAPPSASASSRPPSRATDRPRPPPRRLRVESGFSSSSRLRFFTLRAGRVFFNHGGRRGCSSTYKHPR